MSALGQETPAGAEEVRERVAEILARPEFGPPKKSWIQQVFEKLQEWFPSVSVPDSMLDVTIWIGGALLLAMVIWMVVSLVRRKRWSTHGAAGEAAERDPVAERVAGLLQSAAAAHEAGDLVLALRLYFFALVLGLGKQGDLEYRDTWTNRELLERGRPDPGVRALLGPLVRELDLKSFGRVATTPADVERLASLCRQWLERMDAPRRAA